MKRNPLSRGLSQIVTVGGLVLLSPAAPAQTMYVADYGADRILKFTGGASSTLATGLQSPACLAINSAGDLFVGGQYNGVITEITPGGAKSTFATGLVNPAGLAFDSSGNLYVANDGAGTITEITPQHVQSTFAGGLVYPEGLAFDSAGDLFVADAQTGSGYITKITPQGVESTFASGLNNPVGLAINSAGDLFVADQYASDITEYTPGGSPSLFASVSAPWALAFNNAGDLFEIGGDAPSDAINEFAPDQTETVFDANPGWVTAIAFPVPEPSVMAVLGAGALALLARGRSKSR